MHDNNLLQLITDDLEPAQQLLDLLGQESLALHGRDMQRLEQILADRSTATGKSQAEIASAISVGPRAASGAISSPRPSRSAAEARSPSPRVW